MKHYPGCKHCRVVTGQFIVYRWSPWPKWLQAREDKLGRQRSNSHCLDRVTCKARCEKAQERAKTRGSMLVVAEAKVPDAPRGTCCWCGDPIFRPDQPMVIDRRRRFHYGEQRMVTRKRRYTMVHYGEPDCITEFDRSRTWRPRNAIFMRGDPCCVDCGSTGPWEADHEVALEDGGEHSMENLKRRCMDCHRKKTARENKARAERRRREGLADHH